MYNKTIYVGRLVQDIELRQTGKGTPVTYFTLAVQRNYKNANGEYDADFISCVAYDRVAENMARFLVKGSRVLVEGETNAWSTKREDGTYENHFMNKVNNVTFLDTREDREQLRKENKFNDGGYGSTNPNYEESAKVYKERIEVKPEPKITPDMITDEELPF